MTINIPSINGSKTYIAIGAYLAYNVAVSHNWIAPMADIELLLKGAIAAAFTHKVSKLNDTPPA